MTTKSDKVTVIWSRDDIEALGRLLGHVRDYFKGDHYNAGWQDRDWDAADLEDVTTMHKLMADGLPKDEPKPAPRVRSRPDLQQVARETSINRPDTIQRRGRIIRPSRK